MLGPPSGSTVEARGREDASRSTGWRVARVNILQRLVEEKRRPPGSSTYPRSVMRQHQLQKYRREMVAVANGRVHEVGVGSGLNVPLYGKQVEFVFGIDPSPRLLAIARRRAAPRPVSAPLSPEPEDGRPYPLGRFRHDEPSNRIRKRATSNDLHVPRRGTIGGMILRL